MNAGRVHRLVIVGGGFAGLRAAKSLRSPAVQVTLLDRRNHHVFQPLLCQVALSQNLTSTNSASSRYGLGVALVWWAVGIALVAGYFTHLFRSVRGKVWPELGHGPDASAPRLPNP